MAWRPTQYLITGELENKTLGRVTGWLEFIGAQGRVTLDLAGDFHRDIRGAAIRISGDAQSKLARSFMGGFKLQQTGDAGDITAGLAPFDYGLTPYIEWYSEENGRVVLEPRADQVTVLGSPLRVPGLEPICRNHQSDLFTRWTAGLARAAGVPISIHGFDVPAPADGEWTHWVTLAGENVAEACLLRDVDDESVLAAIRLLPSGQTARGIVVRSNLRVKDAA